MKVETFQDQASTLLNQLEERVDRNVARVGDKSEDCQNCCINLTIVKVRSAINGTEQIDMKQQIF